jgi:3-hydroxyisobutyrate dehydrogenase-like beta-hydroxyacid dehydrogenase
MQVGFIGLGAIGLPMATRMRAAGHHLVVFDVSTAAIDNFIKHGGTRAGSPREVGDLVDIVFYSLPKPDVVRAVTLGPDGLVHGKTVSTIVDLSTTGPTAALQISTEAAQFGKQMMDAPVSGGVHGAAAGTLAIMASGPRDHFEKVEPLLAALGRVFFVGEGVGQGQTMKLLNNVLAANALAATTEMVVLGVKAGLDPRVIIDVLNAGSGRNSASQDKFPRSILNRTFNFGFRTGLMLKDIRLAQTFAREMGVKTRVADAVIQAWTLAEPEFGEEDQTNLAKVLEREAGVVIGCAEAPNPKSA